MQRSKKLFLYAGSSVLGLVLPYLLATFFFMDLAADRWWFQSLGYEGYFWQRHGYQYAVFGAATLVCFALFFLNFRVSVKLINALGPAPTGTAGPGLVQRLSALIGGASIKAAVPICVLLAIVVGYPLFREWQSALLYLFAPAANVTDPLFGKDISYYLFALPFHRLVQRRLLYTLLVLTAGTALFYWAEWRARATGTGLPRAIRVHLSLLLLACAALELWDHWLVRNELVYTNTHQSFYGPGLVEVGVQLPLIWSGILLLTALTGALLAYLNWNRGRNTVAVLAALTMLAFAAGRTSLVHDLVQTYWVKPNEISSERPYIQNSIRATLNAYGLDRVETREYRLEPLPALNQAALKPSVIRNIPVWDRELLEEVFQQLQGIRPYFGFSGVDVDRYLVQDFYQQVFLGARELDLSRLPEAAQNWINRHLKYTHGLGIVMTPAAQDGEDPITWFLRDIPPRSDYALTLANPAIYFGLKDYDYAIAPSDIDELSPSADPDAAGSHYQGAGGVPISSLFRKLFYSIYFQDSDIFFTRNTNSASRILYRRNVLERVRTLTPFLIFDEDPYVVSDQTNLYWILDAYTTSPWYPNAEPFDGRLNYLRNAAKVLVNAYTGQVTYYLADPTDPISNAYRRIYPGLFQPLSAMKPELRRHLRYPRDLFEVQMRIYARYHQTEPDRFFNQEDTWQFAQTYRGDQAAEITPYYVTLNLLDPARYEFLLLAPMSPKGLDTLRGLVVAGCDEGRYGRISTFYFPKGTQVYGPSQIHALIDQDTRISQEFTLWDQVGSAIERGRMLVFPTAGTILYIQPVYLKSTTRLKIPELKRIIVSQGDYVVMDTNLEAGFATLQERLQQHRNRLEGARQPAAIEQPEPVNGAAPERPRGKPAGTGLEGGAAAGPNQ